MTKTCGNCYHTDEPSQFRSLIFCKRYMVDVNQFTVADNCEDYSNEESHDSQNTQREKPKE